MTDASGPDKPSGRRHPWRQVIEWVVILFFALLIAGLLHTFVVQAFYVPTGSMLPTLQPGDRVVVIKFGYTIQRGDIIVFRRAAADTDTQAADLVKRVIGLPGETISSLGDTVLINGRPIAEPWLPELTGACYESAFNIPKTKIAAGHYFVMGDCRRLSYDSRYWGTVPAGNVVGKVIAIAWRHKHPYLQWF